MIANTVRPANSNGSAPSAEDDLEALVQRAFARGGTFLDLLWVLAHSPQRDVPGHALRRLLNVYELTEAVREALHDPVVLETLDLVRVSRAAESTLVEFHFAEPQSLPRATPVGVVRVHLGRIVGFYVGDGYARLRPGDVRLQWFVITETLAIHIQRVVQPTGEQDDVLQITAANVLTSTVSLRRFYLPRWALAPEAVEEPTPEGPPPPPLPPLAEVLALEHRLPGRVRVHVFKLYRNDSLKQRLEQQLRLQIGVKQVSANPLTGRVLVTFDPEALSVEDLQEWINRVVHGRELRGAEQLDRPHPPWHVLDAASAIALWRSDGERGLDEAEVAARRRELGPNVVVSTPPRSRLQIFLDQFRSLPVMLLGASAVLSLATGGLADAVVIAAVVLANATIGYRTERWAEETIADLLKGDEIVATVVRSGQVQELPAHELVPGDIVLLRRGTIVPADGLLLAADSLSVDESALTGESVPVAKSVHARPRPNDPLSARRNMVYRGTVVTGGTGRALVVATGNFTEIGKVQRLISEAQQPETPLQRQLDLLGTQLVLTTVAVCGGVFLVGLVRGRGFLRMLQTSVSLMVAAVPEGLPTVATTTLALGMRRLQQQQVLVRRLNAVETLGAVQDLCLDKTGTITWNRMSVVAAYCGFRSFARQEGRFAGDGLSPAEEAPELLEMLRVAALCSEVEAAVDERGG
ncbi:MAG: HAD-IC family P-type ATPase [Anaerolineae bacterium]|nr:HAD-IC family P-type ATPase [Anaerolineae bacterium]